MRHRAGSSRLNIWSIRAVTVKPPKTLMLATRIPTNASTDTATLVVADLQQGADDDDAADRVGHRHQRGVQRVVDVADHVEPDDHRQHEDHEVAEERLRARPRRQQEQRRGGAHEPQPRFGAHRHASAAASASTGGAAAAAGAADTCTGGGGQRTSPSWTTVMPRWTASSRSRASSPSLLGRHQLEQVHEVGAEQLRGLGRQPPGQVGVAEDDDAVVGDHVLVGDRLPATLPPLAAAMSTTTLPGFIEATISSVSSRGAGRPGISAVVMTMSTSLACCGVQLGGLGG